MGEGNVQTATTFSLKLTLNHRAERVEKAPRGGKVVPTVGDLDADDGLAQAERLVHLQQRPRPREHSARE